jgi:hypothetical protein
MDYEETGFENAAWIHLAQIMVQRRALVNTARTEEYLLLGYDAV